VVLAIGFIAPGLLVALRGETAVAALVIAYIVVTSVAATVTAIGEGPKSDVLGSSPPLRRDSGFRSQK
jgi:hypothetical protein